MFCIRRRADVETFEEFNRCIERCLKYLCALQEARERGSKFSRFCISLVKAVRDVTFPSGEMPLTYLLAGAEQGVMPA